MQREHLTPLSHTGLRSASMTGAPQGSQMHPQALGGRASTVSVSQSVSMQDLRMASQGATGFQHYAGSPQDARPGPSGHPNPGQNAQNVAQGYYRNTQAAPGPVRSNSTAHAQYAPYPQPQYNNGYAQVTAGHGNYPAPSANAQNRRASMPSLNAAQSQPQQVAPISHSARSSGQQNGSAGPSSMPQAPEPPRPHPQPHRPERNPPGMIPPHPAPASAPAPSQYPQTPQASVHPPPSNALPTPPSPSAGPPNVQSAMLQLANQEVRSMLEPMRDSIASSLSTVHLAFTEELSKAHLLTIKSEARARDSQALVGVLRDELARVCAERDRALERCEQMKKEREAALEDIRRMNENLPKLVVEHYQLKGEHDNLQQELVALKETNAQLREKAALSLDAASRFHTQVLPPELLRYSTQTPGVKLEFPSSTPGGTNPSPAAAAQVKEEQVAMKESGSPTDSDADVAFALMREFKVRKNKLRDQSAPEQGRLQSITRQEPPPPSESAAVPSITRVNPPPCNVPPTPPADLSPQSRKIPLGNAPVAHTQTPPTRGAQSVDADAGAHGPKLEDIEALQSALLSSIPQLGHMGSVAGELDIIDLTTLDGKMTESPAQLPLDLPSFSPRSPESGPGEERKRTVEPEWNERQETPNKKQRTEDQVDASATQDVVMEDSDSPEFNEAFLRSLVEAAEVDDASTTSRPEADQTMASPAPVSSTGSACRGDGQGTTSSSAAGPELNLDGHNDQDGQRAELGPTVHSAPQAAANRVPTPATGLLTPPSPTPTSIPPPILRPVQRPESKPQQAPVVVAPAPAPIFPTNVAPAPCPAPVPPETAQCSIASACPPPPPSTPSSSSLRLPASSPTSPCLPPPLPPPTRSIPTTAKRLPSRISVATSSSSLGPPVLPSSSPSISSPQVPPVTPVVNALAGINLSLPSPTNAVQLPTDVQAASPPKPEPPKKLGISHINLIYRRVGCGYYQCRFCERRHKEVPGCPMTKFAANAPGYILTEHFEKEHPTSVEKVLEMSPEDIRESKQGLEFMDSEKSAPVPQKKRKSTG